MRTTFSLAAYAVKIRSTVDHSDHKINCFDGKNDLFDILRRYFDELTKATEDKDARQVLAIRRLEEDDRTLFGIIETGNYGLESKLYDVKKKSVTHRRSQTEADMLPFFFQFVVPLGTDEAILVLQRTGKFGIRKVLSQILRARFQKDYPSLRLNIMPLVLEEEIRGWLRKGRITQIRFVKFGFSSDIADLVEGGHQEIPGKLELVASVSRGSRFNLSKYIDRVLQGKSANGLLAIDDFDYDCVKVGIAQRNGGTKLFNLNDLAKIRSYYDVTDGIEFGNGGHPDFASIKSKADELLSRIFDQLYQGVE